MKNRPSRIWTIYTGILVVFSVLIYVVSQWGSHLEIPEVIQTLKNASPQSLGAFDRFLETVGHNILEPTAMLLLQMLAILLAARFMGYLFAKMGQPTVIGEILAGILLGPSLLGHFYPEAYQFLFSEASLNSIYILSQIGLVLFMFVIGMELNISELKGKMSQTFVISHASIVIPYFFGMLLAYFLYETFAATYAPFLPFALFIGISMSITAFPVLARIIQEKDLSRTHLGSMSLAVAAIGDVTAWCLLAAVIAIASTGSVMSSLYTIFFSMVYVLIMMLVVKPFLKKIGELYKTDELVNKSMVAFIFILLIASSYATQLIGIHALFGAFMVGVIMPPMSNFRRIISEKVEDVSITLLLPLFFVFTGLRTEIGLLNTPLLWAVCALVILVAILGKFGGTVFAAKLMGEKWKDSLIMGILMNTRGLMELIVLNIGYEMGVLPPAIFVMLVIMAIATTFMTTPLMSFVDWLMPDRDRVQDRIHRESLGIFKALVSMGNPENGMALVKVAKSVLDGSKNSLTLNVLHITAGTDINMELEKELYKDSFLDITTEANRLGIPIETEYKVTDQVSHEIVETTNKDDYDFLLVGAGASLTRRRRNPVYRWLKQITVPWIHVKADVFYPGSLIRDKTRYFIENAQCSVGVFVNRNFHEIHRTLVFLDAVDDLFLLRYAKRLIRNNSNASIQIMDTNDLYTSSPEVAQAIINLMKEFPNKVKMCGSTLHETEVLKRFSLMTISYQAWNRLAEIDSNALEHIPSTLIINKKRSRFH